MTVTDKPLLVWTMTSIRELKARDLAAAPTRAAIARLIGVSPSTLSSRGRQVSEAEPEHAVALASPGQLLRACQSGTEAERSFVPVAEWVPRVHGPSTFFTVR